jgi:hypothetical protein
VATQSECAQLSLYVYDVAPTAESDVANYFVAGNAWAVEQVHFADAPAIVLGIADVNLIIAAGGFMN